MEPRKALRYRPSRHMSADSKFETRVNRLNFLILNAQIRKRLLLTGVTERLHQEWNRGVLLRSLHVAPGLSQRVATVVAFEIDLSTPILH